MTSPSGQAAGGPESPKASIVAGRDVPWLLARQAARFPDKEFLVWAPFSGPSERWTYARFYRDVLRVAGGLAARGVGRGDKVLIHLDNCPQFPLAWFACAHLGAVPVTTNTRSVRRDLSYFADKTRPRLAITSADYATLLAEAVPGVPLLTTEPDGPESGPGAGGFARLLDAEPAPPPGQARPFADLAIQFTSGTTARPKAVLWTHANAIWAAQVTSAALHLRHDDVVLTFLPLFHTNAQSYSMLSTLWTGGTMVLQPKFSASRFWAVSVEHGATWCSMVRFCVRALADRQAPAGHRYRFWAPAARMPEIEERFGLRTLGWWGMTETVAHPIVGSLDQPGPALGIGRCSPAYEVSIRREDGSPARPGERGLLFVRGVRGLSMFKEYFGDASATNASFDSDGWFATGDVIQISGDGDLIFGDRAKDMIRVGSENVAASEIEAVVMESGLVLECAAVGRPDAGLDEVPVVFAVPIDPEAANIASRVLDFCNRNLPSFKVPREVRLITALPRSTLEKISKDTLRRLLVGVPLEGTDRANAS